MANGGRKQGAGAGAGAIKLLVRARGEVRWALVAKLGKTADTVHTHTHTHTHTHNGGCASCSNACRFV